MICSLKLFYYYKLAALKKIFGSASGISPFNSSIKNHFGHQTFRFPEKATKDFLISLKIYFSLLKGVFQKQKYILTGSNSNTAIFDSDLNSVGLRREYIKNLSGEDVSLIIARSELRKSTGLFSGILVFLGLIISFPFVFFVSVFSSNKLRAPLHILNTVEGINFVTLLSARKISKLHFFNIYENDANLLAYVLMKCGIEVNKISSEVPLQFWNRAVVADSLSLCFRYQQDEYEFFNKTMHVRKIQHWVPENSFELKKYYVKKNIATKENTIGFYSSAMWLREELGRIDLKNNAYLNEQNLFKFLLDFVNRNFAYKLIIFPHPLEKAHLERTKAYYGQLSQHIELADLNVPNPQQFHKADVGVTLLSTLSYERIFWGFKTLIYPLGYDDFPIENSNFNNVCAKSERELELRLRAALDVGKDEFFEVNKLKGYRYFEYPVFKN